MMDNKIALGQEWTTLQNNYERYESGALMLKLVAVVLFFAGVALLLELWWICLLVLVLWLQEGIFKTYQSRLGARLMLVERLLAAQAAQAEEPKQAFQLHSSWLAQRRGAARVRLSASVSLWMRLLHSVNIVRTSGAVVA